MTHWKATYMSYGPIVAPIIHKKLFVELKKCLASDHSNKKWTLDELCNAILKEVEILEVGQSNLDLPQLPHWFIYDELKPKHPTTV